MPDFQRHRSRSAVRRRGRTWNLHYLAAAAIVVGCTLVSGVSYWWQLTDANVVMIFLAGIALCAARYGRGPALAAIGLSILSFSYFFIHPPFTFSAIDKQYVITLIVTVGMSLLISELTSRLRTQLRASQAQERRTSQLYRMTREFGKLAGADNLLAAAGCQIAATFAGDAVLLLRESDGSVRPAWGASGAACRDPAAPQIAQWVSEHGRPAGRATEAWPESDLVFVPLSASQQLIGVLGVKSRFPDRFDDPEERRMLEACGSLVGQSLERARSQSEAQQAQMQVQTEQLRNNLLASISHDLRSPLATIAVTASSLLESPPEQSWDAKRAVLETVVDETRQLNRQVDNLLEMGRLNSGEVDLNRDWYVLEEMVGVALSRLRRELEGYSLRVDIPADFPLLLVGHELIEQVLVNLLENAIRYTPAGSLIAITAERHDDVAIISIADNGPGLPPGAEFKVFDKFFRGTTLIADGRRGLGLGLAICRSIVRAHGGQIIARNRPAGGAEFVISLPCSSSAGEVNVDAEPASNRG